MHAEFNVLKRAQQHLLKSTLPAAKPVTEKKSRSFNGRPARAVYRPRPPPSVKRRLPALPGRRRPDADVDMYAAIEQQAQQSVKSLMGLIDTALPGIQVPAWIQKQAWRKQLDFYTRAVETTRREHAINERVLKVQETREQQEQKELVDLLINNCKLSEKQVRSCVIADW